jgi:hypothetical protein
MGYQFKGSRDSVVVNVEQARRRNAELRIELGALLTENTQIEARIKATRADLTAAYRKLSKQIRDMDAINAQAELVAASERFVSTLPEPKYGGREGLQAATDEMMAHEARGLKLAKAPRPIKGPSHGTGRRYDLGCRCEECETWKVEKNAKTHSNWKRRQQEKVAA